MHPSITELKNEGVHRDVLDRISGLERGGRLGELSLPTFLIWCEVAPFIKKPMFGSHHVEFLPLQVALSNICEYGGIIASRNPERADDIVSVLGLKSYESNAEGEILEKMSRWSPQIAAKVLADGEGRVLPNGEPLKGTLIENVEMVSTLFGLHYGMSVTEAGVSLHDKAGLDRLFKQKCELSDLDTMAFRAFGIGAASAIHFAEIYRGKTSLSSEVVDYFVWICDVWVRMCRPELSPFFPAAK